MNDTINETFTKHLRLLHQHLKPVLNEGKMNQLSMDLEELSDDEFEKKHGKTKSQIRALLKVNENDDASVVDPNTLTHLERIEVRIKSLNKLIYNNNTAVLPDEVKQRLKNDLKNLLDGMVVMINK